MAHIAVSGAAHTAVGSFLWQALVQVLFAELYLRPGAITDVMFTMLLSCVALGRPLPVGTGWHLEQSDCVTAWAGWLLDVCLQPPLSLSCGGMLWHCPHRIAAAKDSVGDAIPHTSSPRMMASMPSGSPHLLFPDLTAYSIFILLNI